VSHGGLIGIPWAKRNLRVCCISPETRQWDGYAPCFPQARFSAPRPPLPSARVGLLDDRFLFVV
jgi:hypothetical protein